MCMVPIMAVVTQPRALSDVKAVKRRTPDAFAPLTKLQKCTTTKMGKRLEKRWFQRKQIEITSVNPGIFTDAMGRTAARSLL